MRESVRIAALAIAITSAIFWACGGDHPQSPAPPVPGPPPVPPPDPPPTGIADPVPSTDPLGKLQTVDELAVTCVTTSAPRTILFGPADGGVPVRRLEALGTRRMASGPNLRGFVTFDSTGANPVLYGTEAAYANDQTLVYYSEGSTVGLFATGKSARYHQYDATGAPAGQPVDMAGETEGVGFAGYGGGSTLGMFLIVGALNAGGITNGMIVSSFSVGTNLTDPRVAIGYGHGHFIAAISSNIGLTRVLVTDATGPNNLAVELTTALGIIPIGFAETKDGFLLLVDTGGDDHVYLVPLDVNGRVSGFVHRLVSSAEAFGIATNGTDVGIVSMNRGSKRPQFRAVDSTGHPLGPWVCLDTEIPDGQAHDVAVAADGAGWSIVFQSTRGVTTLVRTDRVGSGPL
jgi:hypothetical protein